MSKRGHPLSRQVVKRVPPNVPRDVLARERPTEFDPSYYYGVGSPRAGGRAVLNPTVSFPPPWVFPPPVGARNFYPTSSQAVGPGPTGWVALAATAFVVPQNNWGVIREINLNVNNLLATSNITFQLRVNSAAVEGFDALFVFPRPVASFSSSFGPESTMVFLPEGAQVQMYVNVVDAAAYVLGASYRGWFYPKAVGQRYQDAY